MKLTFEEEEHPPDDYDHDEAIRPSFCSPEYDPSSERKDEEDEREVVVDSKLLLLERTTSCPFFVSLTLTLALLVPPFVLTTQLSLRMTMSSSPVPVQPRFGAARLRAKRRTGGGGGGIDGSC